MFNIPDDAVLTVSFDIRAVTPNGSEHLFTHVASPTDVTVDNLADTMATLSIDAGGALLDLANG